MAILRRRTKLSQRGWTDAHRHHLDAGHAWPFSDGFETYGWTVDGNWHSPPNDDPQIEAEQREAWQELGDEIIAEHTAKFPGARPWAFWRFDHERDGSLDEPEQLERLGLLTDSELEQLRQSARGVVNDMYEPPFRRSWGWWRFLSPSRREPGKPEAMQLIEMELRGAEVLTAREQHIVKHRRDLDRWPPGVSDEQRRTLRYLRLDDSERAFIGLEDA